MSDDKPPMPPSRALVLNVMLSFLVSTAVFVVVSWLVLIPQMARQQVAIQVLQAEVADLRQQVDEVDEEEPSPPGAAAPGAPAAPAAAAPAAPAKK